MSGNGSDSLKKYYQFHSHVYDATRWSFLFGREAIVRMAARELGSRVRPGGLKLLEVGCGTGRNLKSLDKKFPGARITGLDLCPSMLARAEKNISCECGQVNLVQECYEPSCLTAHDYDLVLFSYALSMFNPGFERALDTARYHLRPGGVVAVVDFHSTRFSFFEKWMGVNHVRMDNQILPALNGRFITRKERVKKAYFGFWYYFMYIGEV